MRVNHHAHKRARMLPGAIIAGVVGSALLGLSTTGTLSSFTAQLNNSTDTTASGSLVMTETGTGATTGSCASSSGTNGVYTCSTINKFGGATGLLPGASSVGTITIGNSGTAAATSFTLAPTSAGTSPNFGCASSNVGSSSGTATDACTVFQLKIESGSTVVYSGSLAGLSSIDLSAAGSPATNLTPPVGGSTPFKFTVTVPAGTGNAYQGKQVSLPLTWSFSAGS